MARRSAQPRRLEECMENLRGQSVRRTTIVLPVAMGENWNLAALKEGKGKGEILVRELADFLIAQGMQPDKTPKDISIGY